MPANRPIVLTDDPFGVNSFEWPVCPMGYEWRRRRFSRGFQAGGQEWDREDDVLFPRDAVKELQRPLGDPLLFRQLAETRLELAAVGAFAEAHGLLGLPVRSRPTDRHGPPFESDGEAFSEWWREIVVIRTTVRIWDAIQKRDADRLRHNFLRWREADLTTRKVCGDFGQLAEIVGREADQGTAKLVRQRLGIGGHPDDWLFLGRDDDDRPIMFGGLSDPERPARERLDRWDAALKMVAERCRRALRDHCCPYLRERPRKSGYTLAMIPKNLLGAAWFQVSRLVSGEASIGRCSVCGTEIEHSRDGEGFRADKEFCSNACKMNRVRQRVREAKRMREEGRTVRQIAKHFGRSQETIEKWLGQKK